MTDTQAMTVRLSAPLYELLRKMAFEQRTSMNALIAQGAIWRVWNSLPDSEPSPVKRIARDLGLEPAEVAFIVYPAEEFGSWAEDQEPDLP